jgi:hypothetical protein
VHWSRDGWGPGSYGHQSTDRDLYTVTSIAIKRRDSHGGTGMDDYKALSSYNNEIINN